MTSGPDRAAERELRYRFGTEVDVKVRTGRVKNGTIHVEGERLSEGTVVTVVTEDEPTFTLEPDEERELLEAIAEADRGDFISPEELFPRGTR